MTDTFPSVAELDAEERDLQLASFTNDNAWDLGSALVAAARRDGAPVAVEITRTRHGLFSAVLPGASPDNQSWIDRKTRVLNRFGYSSLYVRQASIQRGTSFEAEFGLNPRRYAAHGGAFPILVRSVGPVGVVVVSGLPQLEDHRMVVGALRAHLAG